MWKFIKTYILGWLLKPAYLRTRGDEFMELVCVVLFITVLFMIFEAFSKKGDK